MIDFTALRAAAPPDADEISRQLDPRYVLERYGHRPAAQEAGRWLYHSPFRPDTTPSYTVRRLEDGRYRCGDLARGEEGDVLDLIHELTGRTLSFGEKMIRARNLLEEQQRTGWTAPALVAAPQAMPVTERVLEVIRTAPTTALEAFLASRDGALRHLPAAFLRYHYGVAEIGPDLLIPYTHPDGSIAALKKREAGGRTESLPGYRYAELLYGAHLLTQQPNAPVLLCEGETDTWAAFFYGENDGHIAVGLPAGAHGPLSEAQRNLLSRRVVYLCFDADESGDAAAAAWSNALGGCSANARRVRPPEGRDLASLEPEQLQELLP